MDYTQEFLEQFRQLEKEIKDKYGYDFRDGGVVRKFCREQNPPTTLRHELELCADVRNILAHNPRTRGDVPVAPGRGMVDMVKDAIGWITNPPNVMSVWISYPDVYAKSMEDEVLPALKDMADNAFTHVPILEDGRVIGAFSENTLLSCVLDEEISHYDKGTRFSDIARYLPIENHITEVFGFVAKDASLSDVKKTFDDALQSGDRLGMLFVTHSGKESEKLLGIVTAWDVAGVDLAE